MDKYPLVKVGEILGLAHRTRTNRLEVMMPNGIWMSVLNEADVKYQGSEASIDGFIDWMAQVEHSDDKFFTYGH